MQYGSRLIHLAREKGDRDMANCSAVDHAVFIDKRPGSTHNDVTNSFDHTCQFWVAETFAWGLFDFFAWPHSTDPFVFAVAAAKHGPKRHSFPRTLCNNQSISCLEALARHLLRRPCREEAFFLETSSENPSYMHFAG